jgi:hypothetical protein
MFAIDIAFCQSAGLAGSRVPDFSKLPAGKISGKIL